MNAWLAGCAVLAALAGLRAWAHAVPTRAWGDGAANAAARRRAMAAVVLTLALQGAASGATLGPAGATAFVPASWMVMGWGFTLAMNQWPHGSRRWAGRLGMAGIAGGILGVAAKVLQV